MGMTKKDMGMTKESKGIQKHLSFPRKRESRLLVYVQRIFAGKM
jgi:hypothetical protein